MTKRLILALAALLLLLPAIGSAQDKPWDPAAGTATISGSVKFTAKPPRVRKIDMAGADAKCAPFAGFDKVTCQAEKAGDGTPCVFKDGTHHRGLRHLCGQERWTRQTL